MKRRMPPMKKRNVGVTDPNEENKTVMKAVFEKYVPVINKILRLEAVTPEEFNIILKFVLSFTS